MPENTKENDTQPTRSIESDLDFRTRLAASSDVSESKRANRIAPHHRRRNGSGDWGRILPIVGEMRGPGADCTLCLCRRNAERNGVTFSGLLGRFGFRRRVHLSFSGNTLPARRGWSHLRDTSGLPAKFPEDLWLQQIGAESYIGVPMRNAQGRTLGHLAVLHQEPMEPSEEDIAVLQIFAARGCAELERKQAHEKLSKAHEDLRRLNLETTALLNVNRAIGHHLNRDVLFGALADCLQTVVPTDRFGIVLPPRSTNCRATC